MTKRFSLVLALVAFAAILAPAAAFGNFAIHGNYVDDTDACAGCHRAHTSVSSLTWTATTSSGVTSEHSALLVSSATTMEEFCLVCHDSAGQSADTNVTDGLYYGTDYGTPMGILNGGGFESFDNIPTTSSHVSDGSPWGAYGGGYAGAGKIGATGQPILGLNEPGESNKIKMDCATCHDPHGSANYRILKAQVNGNPVGGYVPSGDPQNPTPDGFVSSVETGWPANGFELHTAYPAYQPNYTKPMYAKGYNMADGTVNDAKGMSGWCSGCHSTYIGDSTEQFTNAAGVVYQSLASTYLAGDSYGTDVGRVSVGYLLRHKHPVNVSLSTYNGPDKSSMIVTDLVLPVANDLGEAHVGGAPVTSDSDWIECLTCHRAHGTIAAMSGFADNPVDPDDPLPTFAASDVSALLRMDNRGVCEACHNK